MRIKIIFAWFLVGGGLLKPNIMVRKGAIVTYIWGFHENFENYRKLVL